MHVIDASPKTVESFYDINEMSFHFMKGGRAIFVDHPGFTSSLECKFPLDSIFSLSFQI